MNQKLHEATGNTMDSLEYQALLSNVNMDPTLPRREPLLSARLKQPQSP